MARSVSWVKPTLVAEVGFAEWTAAGLLRQPVFKGMRDARCAWTCGARAVRSARVSSLGERLDDADAPDRIIFDDLRNSRGGDVSRAAKTPSALCLEQALSVATRQRADPWRAMLASRQGMTTRVFRRFETLRENRWIAEQPGGTGRARLTRVFSMQQ